MANYPLPRRPDGALALPGGMTKAIVEDFLFATALPGWLAASYTGGTGSCTVSNAAAGRGEVALTTPAVSGSQAVIKTASAIDTSKVAWVWWELEGFYVDSNAGISLFMGINDSTFGAFVRADPEPAVRCNAYTSPLLHDWWLSNNEWGRRKNRGLLLLTGQKRLYLMDGDQEIQDVDLTSVLQNGPIFPSVTIRADAAAAKTIKIGRMSLRVGTY